MKNRTKYILFLLLGFLVVGSVDATAQKRKKKKKAKTEAGKDEFQLVATFIDAAKQKMLGNLSEAEALYLECLKIDSKHDAAYYELGNIKYMESNIDEALVLGTKALDLKPKNEWYNLFVAEIHANRGEYDLAEQLYERLVDTYPKKYDYLYELATSQLYQGKLKEAIKVYDRIEELVGISEDVSVQKEKLYLELDDIENAVKELEKLSAYYPRESRYMGMLAEVYNVNGMDQKAFEIYQRMEKSVPDDPIVQLSLAEYYKNIGKYDDSFQYLRTAFANSKLGIDPKIKVMLSYYQISESDTTLTNQAYELLGLLVDVHDTDPKSHAMMADFLYRDSRLKESQAAFYKTIELDSSRFLVWSQLANVNYELRDYDALLRDSKTAGELFPNQAVFYLFTGLAYSEKNKPEEAIEVLERGKFYAGRQPELKLQMLNILGDIYNTKGEFAKSDKTYDSALEIDPNNALVLNNYAYYLSERNERLEDAERMSKKSNVLVANSASYEDTYGWILYRLGKYEEALIWIDKALKHGGDNSGVIVEHRGDVLSKLGRKEEAIAEWKRAKTLGETTDSIDQKIASGEVE